MLPYGAPPDHALQRLTERRGRLRLSSERQLLLQLGVGCASGLAARTERHRLRFVLAEVVIVVGVAECGGVVWCDVGGIDQLQWHRGLLPLADRVVFGKWVVQLLAEAALKKRREGGLIEPASPISYDVHRNHSVEITREQLARLGQSNGR